MKITQFSAPGNNGDFTGNAALAAKWSAQMSQDFDQGVADVNGRLAAHGGGTSQFYNPLTHGLTGPDVTPPSAGDITWNGFPRRFLGVGPGAPPNFAAAEAPVTAGHARVQDEYLEWHATKNAAGKITSVQFTCEGYDYFQFLGKEAPDILLGLYQKFISPAVKHADLFSGTKYQITNRWNTADGAMHLTQSANNLFAEIILAAEATVRRKDAAGHEITSAIPLTNCAQFGDPARNSDPTIGAGVNGFARQGRMITLADPVGLYIDHLDDSGFRLPGNLPVTGWFQILRGAPGHTLRAVFAPPAGSPLTVSDVSIGGTPIKFGGQIAQNITMKLTGAASVATGVHNAPIPCEGAAPAAAALAAPRLPMRGGV